MGIHDGCRIAVLRRIFSEGGGLVNCEVGQEVKDRGKRGGAWMFFYVPGCAPNC